MSLKSRKFYFRFVNFIIIILLSGPLMAQELENEFIDKDIEKLMSLDVFFTTVISTHIHKAGNWMFGFSQGYKEMGGLRTGTNNIGPGDVLRPVGTYMVTPLDMSMYMSMFHVMYALSDKTTLMLIGNYSKKNMNLRNMAGMNFSTQSKGFGDVVLNVNHVLNENDNGRFLAGLGLSLPVGSINQKDNTPLGFVLLSYPMQMGSGSYDLQPQVIYERQDSTKTWLFTTQFKAIVRMNNNSHKYRLGNIEQLNVWLTKSLNDHFATSVRLFGEHKGRISGRDSNINPMISPVGDPSAQEKTTGSVFIAANAYISEGKFKGNNFIVEIGKPFYQKFSGIQLKTKWVGKFSWTCSF